MPQSATRAALSRRASIRRRRCACVVVVLGVALSSRAGDLAPPAGPIAPTAKALSEVEPRTALTHDNTPGDANSVFRIVTPGSYYLTADLSVPSGTGIEVIASDVTIDLNGFSVVGAVATAGIGYDPLDPLTPKRLTVKNGRLMGGNFGVSAGGLEGCRLERLVCTDTQSTGLAVGANGLIRDCVTRNAGISVGVGSVAERCVANDKAAGSGINCNSGSRITDCVAIGNGQDGIRAFVGSDNVLIEGCFVSGNADGIAVSASGCTIVRNVAKGNAGDNYYITGAGNHVGAIVSDPALAGPWDNISN